MENHLDLEITAALKSTSANTNQRLNDRSTLQSGITARCYSMKIPLIKK